MGDGFAIPKYLRNHLDAITRRYERVVTAQLPDLERLPKGALIDHLPEFLDTLATWIESDAEERKRPFLTLADGHSLTRLGFGITLETLTEEYVLLRQVILEELLVIPSSDSLRRELITFHLGMDQAVMAAVRRYASQRDELRERFIAILGHDLRSPLSAISMGAQALAEENDLDARQIKIVGRITRGVDRMERMIGDVLDFARGHLGGGIPAVPMRHDLGKLCEAAVDEVLAAHPDRQVRAEVTGNLGGHWDADRVSQALGNLLANAVTHGRDPIVLRAWEADDKRNVFTSVSSTGTIPRDLLPRLFEPFRGERKQGGGLGLGLYIAQQIVLAHGGFITVTSDDATTFTIQWPRVRLEKTPSR